ncbi:ATP-dependent Clp protease proteolytic subunit [wastewater metagenome]|uniref:ATP-dependent Clp protease proteolytic subunit n=2 Tax=unclassified sequences TaxID=12908 RepID=A0A5B8RHR3_9ZZZZ|nr:ATP-dependent Clp protease proteolytic subunit [uncultured organism]
MKSTLFNIEIETKEKEDQTVAEMTIDGIIGEDMWSAEDDQNTKQRMREQLRQVDAIEADKIVVNISSLGGDVDHGLAIHDLLASNDARVETNVIGMTASAATIIAQAGDERFMSDNALYLVHRAWTIGMGNANDFQALADDLTTLDDRISNIYAKRSDKDQQEFMDLMNESNGDGIWISAEEAKEYGLIDTITEPMKAAAMDKSVFEKYNIPKPPQAEEKDDQLTVSIDGSKIAKAIKDEFRNDGLFLGDKEAQDIQEAEEASVSAPSRERIIEQLALTKIKAQIQ